MSNATNYGPFAIVYTASNGVVLEASNASYPTIDDAEEAMIAWADSGETDLRIVDCDGEEVGE